MQLLDLLAAQDRRRRQAQVPFLELRALVGCSEGDGVLPARARRLFQLVELLGVRLANLLLALLLRVGDEKAEQALCPLQRAVEGGAKGHALCCGDLLLQRQVLLPQP